MEEYFKLYQSIILDGYDTGISNLRLRFIDKDSMISITNKIKNKIVNYTLFNELKESWNINKDDKIPNTPDTKFKKMISDIVDIRYCEMKQGSRTSLILFNSISLGKNIDNKNIDNKNIDNKNIDNKNIDNKNIDNIKIHMETENPQSNIIRNYVLQNNTFLSQNLKRKNKKNVQSLSEWKRKYLGKDSPKVKEWYVDDHLLERKETNGICVNRSVSMNMTIINDKVITSGRTLLPNSIFITFLNKSRISMKDDLIQIMPSKNNISFEENVKDLIYFIKNVIVTETQDMPPRLDFILSYNFDIVFPINKNIKHLPTGVKKINNFKTKFFSNSIIISGITSYTDYIFLRDKIVKIERHLKIFNDKLDRIDNSEILWGMNNNFLSNSVLDFEGLFN